MTYNVTTEFWEGDFNLLDFEYGDYYLVINATDDKYNTSLEIKSIGIHPLITYYILENEISYKKSGIIVYSNTMLTTNIDAEFDITHHPVVKERDFEIYVPEKYEDAIKLDIIELKYFLDTRADIEICKDGKELESVYINEHSWAGREQYTIEALILNDGKIEQPPNIEYGGWYSENGRIIKHQPPTEPGEYLEDIYNTYPSTIAIVFNSFSDYNREHWDQYHIIKITKKRAFEIIDEHNKSQIFELTNKYYCLNCSQDINFNSKNKFIVTCSNCLWQNELNSTPSIKPIIIKSETFEDSTIQIAYPLFDVRDIDYLPDKLKEAVKLYFRHPDKLEKHHKDIIYKNLFTLDLENLLESKRKPRVDSFGNIKQKTSGKQKVETSREPLVEINEEADQFIVIAEMPGVIKDDVELKATGRSLTISTKADGFGKKYHKEIELPAAINSDFAKARLTNGILEVKLKKIDEKHTNIKID